LIANGQFYNFNVFNINGKIKDFIIVNKKVECFLIEKMERKDSNDSTEKNGFCRECIIHEFFELGYRFEIFFFSANIIEKFFFLALISE
jgi:hypothetical protein